MNETNLPEILEAYALAAPEENNQQTLREWMDKYPQFAADLMDFAAARAIVRYSPEPEIAAADESRYKEFGLNNLREILSGSAEKNETAIASLTELAKAKGLNKLKFAAALDVSLSLVMYLENKRLEFASIPRAVIGKIAQVLETGEDLIASYLNQPPDLATGASYKTETRPDNIKPKSFTEAVCEDQQLSAEQKKKLLDLS
ncbi:MAG: hypothetical protein M3367_06895 [Acidobacteriota bacterium]|nr:hypothetical protein [Acidobacteriota bacterium]